MTDEVGVPRMWTVISASRQATWGSFYEREKAEAAAIVKKKEHPDERWFVCDVLPVGEIVPPRPQYEVAEVYSRTLHR
jgi:hypothetical protein